MLLSPSRSLAGNGVPKRELGNQEVLHVVIESFFLLWPYPQVKMLFYFIPRPISVLCFSFINRAIARLRFTSVISVFNSKPLDNKLISPILFPLLPNNIINIIAIIPVIIFDIVSVSPPIIIPIQPRINNPISKIYPRLPHNLTNIQQNVRKKAGHDHPWFII